MKRYAASIPYLLLAISGACALVYEVTWARYFALFLGHTTLAHMCVLAAFMGGLALGSILIGRMTTGFRRPLAVYGVLELLIGVYAILSPTILYAARSAMLAAGAGLEPGSATWLGLKLVISIATLIIPTVLMGGTFPVLMKYFQPATTSSADKSEWLYAVNCVGAVAGSLLAGFALIPSIGSKSTLLATGVVNLSLGIGAILLARVLAGEQVVRKTPAGDTPDAGRHPLALPVYLAIGVSGLVSMVYELVWIRIFAVTLGSSTYSFTLMLAAFITGISLGSLAVGFVPRLKRNPLTTFAVAEIAIGLAVVLGIPFYERLPYIFWRWSALLSRTPEAFGLLNLSKYSLCFMFMLVPTFFFGMTLPLAIKSVARRDDRIGKDSGFVYGANTVGTLIGALLTGLVLIRFLGLRHSLELAVMLNIGAGMLLLLVSSHPMRRAYAFGACAVGLVLVLAMPAWHPWSFVAGTFRHTEAPPQTWGEYLESGRGMKIHFYSESDDGTVAVAEPPGMRELCLFINGKADASSYSDLCTQILLGQIPMFFHPDARDVLVVGLGSGVTANSILTHPGTTVDCVEISSAVVDAARYFDEANGAVLDNERLNMIVEDARAYVAVTAKKYDVVSSEPTNPWIAGVGNLFSREYYREVDKILKPGGIMAQWIQQYDLSDELMATILRTMLSVFPCVYIFEVNTGDYVVVASRGPISPDFSAMERRLSVPEVREDLARITVDSVLALLGRQAYASADARMMVQSGDTVNTDDHPVLEFQAPKAAYLGTSCPEFNAGDQRLTLGEDLFAVSYLSGKPLSRRQAESLIASYADVRVNNRMLMYSLLRYYLGRWPDDPDALGLYTTLVDNHDASASARAAASLAALTADPRALELRALTASQDLLLAHTAFTPQDFRPALKLLDRAIEANPGNMMLQQMKARAEGLIR